MNRFHLEYVSSPIQPWLYLCKRQYKLLKPAGRVVNHRLSRGTGALLVLPEDPGLWDDTISRWETITINMLNSQSWSDNKSKLLYVENLLGEQEKLMWQQWRTAYAEAYETLIGMADDPQNITSQMRMVIMMEDPYRGSTERQDIAQRDLDRLTCEDTKDLWRFMHEFRILAINSGKLYFPSTTEKYFSKLPPILSQRVHEAFKRKHPGLAAGVLPAIKFTHTFVSEMCKEAALSKELRDLSFCSAVPIPAGLLAIKAIVYKEPPEGEGEFQAGIAVGKEEFMFMVYEKEYEDESDEEEVAFMVRPNFDTPTVTYFPGNSEAIEELRRAAGKKVKELQELRNDQEKRISWVHEENLRLKQQQNWERDQLIKEFEQKIEEARINERKALEERISQLEEKVKRYEEEKFEREFPPLGQSSSNADAIYEEVIMEPQIKEQVANVVLETEIIRNTATDEKPTQPKVRKVVNQLYNVTVEFDIPECPFFKTKAIIDTGASSCFINKEVVPEKPWTNNKPYK
ncbi:hypothetical protein Tco_1492422 [Tanacetum coccineum]